MRSQLTILWTSALEGESELLHERARALEADLTKITTSTLSSTVIPSLARGPVILVASGDFEASLGLSIGVDEVIRSGEVTTASLDRAVERAEVRAMARAARDAAKGQDWGAFTLLAASLGGELAAPLMIASMNCEVAAAAIANILIVSDELVQWASLSAPTEALRRLVAMRAAAPTADDLQRIMGDARASLERAVGLVRTLRELSFDDGQDAISVAIVIGELANLVGGYLKTWAELEATASGPCAARISRSTFTCLVAGVLASAVEAVRAADRADGRIGIHATEQEGCVLVEVHHNGRPTRTDLRPGVLDPLFDLASSPFRSDLAGIRERLRQLGGELLVDSDASRTIVRLFIPSAESEELSPSLGDGWHHVRAGRPRPL